MRPAFAGPVRLSGSVSFASTLMTLAVESSSTVAVSFTASGASFTLVTVTFTVAWLLCPTAIVPLSLIV